MYHNLKINFITLSCSNNQFHIANSYKEKEEEKMHSQIHEDLTFIAPCRTELSCAGFAYNLHMPTFFHVSHSSLMVVAVARASSSHAKTSVPMAFMSQSAAQWKEKILQVCVVSLCLLGRMQLDSFSYKLLAVCSG